MILFTVFVLVSHRIIKILIRKGKHTCGSMINYVQRYSHDLRWSTIENYVENDSRYSSTSYGPGEMALVCKGYDVNEISLWRVRCSDPVLVERPRAPAARRGIFENQRHSAPRSRILDLLHLKRDENYFVKNNSYSLIRVEKDPYLCTRNRCWRVQVEVWRAWTLE